MSVNSATLPPQEQLLARLNEPRTVDALNRLLDRLDVLAFSVEMMDSFFRRSSEVADSIADSVAEVRDSALQEPTGDFLGKIPALARASVKIAETTASPAFERLLESGLLERLAEPHTIENLKSLLDQLDVAAFTLQALDGFLRRSDVIANSIADSVREIRNVAPEAASLVKNLQELAADLLKLLQAGRRLAASGLLDKLDELADAGLTLSAVGMFERQTVTALGEVGRLASQSYDEAKQVPARRIGLIGILRLLNDPAIQPALTLLIETTRRFGEKMK
jgi:uncharacterized protein YjgD (DUF1641 family)